MRGASAGGDHNASGSFQSLGVPAPRKTFLDNKQGTAHKDVKGVVLSEHKVELVDMVQEMVSTLKSVYRSKFVFGDHLRFVDPSFGGDAVQQFNLTTPPTFDPSFSAPKSEELGGGAQAGSEGLRDKLRTAEELIKKLYRRNTQLEVDNKYMKTEIGRLEKLGLTSAKSGGGGNTFGIVDGNLPLEHPLYTRKMRRRCKSCPPVRTLLRTAVGGAGLNVGGQQSEDIVEEPPAVVQMKKRLVQMTEALVAVQHENEKLAREKKERVSLRDNLLRSYLVERDAQIAQLHGAMQELLAKINNPLKLARCKQPSPNVNPVVAANNLLRETAERLNHQISTITGELIKNATQTTSAAEGSASGGQRNVGDGTVSTAPGSPGGPMSPAAVDPSKEVQHASATTTDFPQRRKELAMRVKTLVDTLPLKKKKEMLLFVMELKQIYDALANSNRCLLQAYEELKTRTNNEAVQLKLQVAILKDQIRSLGVRELDDEMVYSPVAQGGARAGGPLQDP